MHLQFNGFYVCPTLTLSMAEQGIIPYSPQYKDIYQIIPMSITANVSSNLSRHCVSAVVRSTATSWAPSATRSQLPRRRTSNPATAASPSGCTASSQSSGTTGSAFGIWIESKQPDGGQLSRPSTPTPCSTASAPLRPGAVKRKEKYSSPKTTAGTSPTSA